MMTISRGLFAGTISTSIGLTDPTTIGVGNKAPIVPRSPLVQKFKKEAFDKYAAKEERWSLNFAVGMGLLEPFVEALKRCGRDLTREKLVAEPSRRDGSGNRKEFC